VQTEEVVMSTATLATYWVCYRDGRKDVRSDSDVARDLVNGRAVRTHPDRLDAVTYRDGRTFYRYG
jgi:hypothetical protein